MTGRANVDGDYRVGYMMEKQGFKQLVKKFNQSYKITGRKYFSVLWCDNIVHSPNKFITLVIVEVLSSYTFT